MNQIEQLNRYSDCDLQEFREIIVAKLALAKAELETIYQSLRNSNPNGTDDTQGIHVSIEDVATAMEKETNHQLAVRQKKFIEQLEAALVRIGNKTYGVCRRTGKLIQKERLIAVPHTTLSIEAKLKQT
jgi:DnaK suppressor protein